MAESRGLTYAEALVAILVGTWPAANSAAAPDANRAAVVPSLLPFALRLAPVSGKPLGR